MTPVDVGITIIILGVLLWFGIQKFNSWLIKRAARKRMFEAERIASLEEALFQENLKNLWQKPKDDDETGEPKT